MRLDMDIINRLGLVGHHINVYLDDVLQDNAFVADEETGTIERYIDGTDGHPVLTADGSELLAETVYGNVRIVPTMLSRAQLEILVRET